MRSRNNDITFPVWPYQQGNTLKNFQNSFPTQVFRAGELILPEGGFSGGPLLITEGLVKVVKGKGENSAFLWFASPGDFLGIENLAGPMASRFNAYAITLTRAVLIPSADFAKMAMEEPEYIQVLIRNLCKKVRVAEERVTSVYYSPVRQRLARLIVHLSEQPRHAGKREFATEFSETDLMHISGASPAYFKKIMKKLQPVLRISGHTIKIIDRELLIRLALGEVPDKSLRPGS